MSLVVYKSSAGSGKTYTLVRAYLTLLLQNPTSFRHILGVTFTNKAANEMKSRIINALEGLSASESAAQIRYVGLMDELYHETGLTKEIIQKRAAGILTELLHHYGDFSISTIDSFVHRLVRTFTYDLGLPHQFDVELDADVVIRKCVDNLMLRIGSDELVTRAMVDLLIHSIDEEKGWQIERQLHDFATDLLHESSFEYARLLENCSDDDFLQSRLNWSGFCKDVENELRQKSRKILSLFDSEMIQEEDLSGGSNSGILKFLQRLIEGEVDHAFGLTSWNKYQSTGKWVSPRASHHAKNAIQSNQDLLNSYLNDIVEYYNKHSRLYYLGKILVPQLYKLSLLAALQRSLIDVMNELNLVHISEFNKRITGIVSGVSAPYIYERLGERYRHYMIDEFQDTSIMQWHNFLPLIDNSLANGHFNLLVGDGKQAIYRWRNGDVDQFINLPHINNPHGNQWIESVSDHLRNHYDTRILDSNFRSSSTVVSFNNSFFGYTKKFLSERNQRVYEDLAQKIIQTQTGYVEIQLVPEEDSDIQGTYLSRTLALVQSLKDEGYSLSDITILVRRNIEGSLIANFLMNNQISVVSAESLLVSSSFRVRALIAAIGYIANPLDDVSRSDFFYFTSMNQVSDGSYWINFLHHETKSRIIGQKSERQLPFDDETRAGLSALGLYDMVEQLIRMLEFGSVSDPFVQFLLEYVHEFDIASKGGPKELIEDWKQKSTTLSIITPEASDSVKVMTVHKAKGLEFKVVIFPFANEKLRNCSRTSMWVNLSEVADDRVGAAFLTCGKMLEKTPFQQLYEDESEKSKLDLMNVLYVAFTRAIDRLYVLSEEPKKSAIFGIPFLIKDFLCHAEKEPDVNGNYCFGKVTSPVMPANQGISMISALSMSSAEWTGKLVFSATDSGDEREPGVLSNRKRGIIVHELLSKVWKEDQIGPLLDHYHFTGRISIEEKPVFHEILSKVFRIDIIRDSVQAGIVVRNEQEMIGLKGNIIRPDRVIEFPDRIVLIDFKTGIARHEHKQQINSYLEVLRKVYSKPFDSYLLYLNDEVELIAC